MYVFFALLSLQFNNITYKNCSIAMRNGFMLHYYRFFLSLIYRMKRNISIFQVDAIINIWFSEAFYSIFYVHICLPLNPFFSPFLWQCIQFLSTLKVVFLCHTVIFFFAIVSTHALKYSKCHVRTDKPNDKH